MASSSGVDYIAKVRKFREVSSIQHESIPANAVAPLLEKISKFLQDHETASQNDCTHAVFDDFHDWWQGQKPRHTLAIGEDSTLDLLYGYIGTCYDLGIPLTLTEKRTPEIRFAQDIEIWGNKNATFPVEELMALESKFARLLGKTMGKLFPKEPFLDVCIFDSSGFSKIKGVMKTFVRLVWSKIVVDKSRALRIRDYLVHKFKECKDDEMKELEGKIHNFNQDLAKDNQNQWGDIFSEAIYSGRFGIRMPLNDRVSARPLQKPQQLPFTPNGVLRFHFEEGSLKEVERVCGKDGVLDNSEWLKIGCVRRPAGEPLTEWAPPVFDGGGVGGGEGGRGPGRSAGQVKLKTKAGSENPGKLARPAGQPGAPEQEKPHTLERKFLGTVDDFAEKLEEQLGKTDDIAKGEGGVTCSHQGTGARVEFRASNKRVYIIGQLNQIRSLLTIITPFVTAVGDSTQSVASSRPRSDGCSAAGASGYAPSAAYTASAVYAPTAAHAPSTASRGTGREAGGGVLSEPHRRVACREFLPDGSGELKLAVGDNATVTHDPEEGQAQNNIHRWVYGLNESTDEKGWFPLSHTNQLQATADEE